VPDSTRSLPDYTVRVSDRARRVRLLVTPREGLVVVVPRRFPVTRVPAIVREHAGWAERTLARTADRREHLASGADAPVPSSVEMPGIGLSWKVELRSAIRSGVRGTVRGDVLELSGAVEDRDACFDALRRAVARAARERLPLMLGSVEAETGWNATRVTVRRQRTRWGSCTAKGALSLNESLVFLPQRLVRYVLVHELAHTRQLDHSPAFWALVETMDAGWREARSDLRDCWRHVPAWADPSGSPQSGEEA
jgi:predicted metal-dependent hydrolase